MMRATSLASRQRGAASLIVVMVLFFVLSLTAAYTGRNLIFEQKTSANQSRSTLAFEAAEAGVEWALVQLNGGAMDAGCVTAAAPNLSFQQRYVAIAPYGALPPPAPATTPAAGFTYQNVRDAAPHSEAAAMWPACVFNGATWDCACPNAAAADPVSVAAGGGPFPAFRVWPASPDPKPSAPIPAGAASSPWGAVQTNNPGSLQLNVGGCTRYPGAGERCLDYLAQGEVGEGLAYQHVTLALRSGLAVIPAAPVTARLDVEPAPLPAPALVVVNTDYRSGGFTVNQGDGGLPSNMLLVTIPGTPSEKSVGFGDTRLIDFTNNQAPATVPPVPAALTSGERMFVSIFGMKRQTYRQQPGLRVCAAPCSAANVNTLLVNNPNRIIWVDGDLTVDANIGTAAVPVLLIVNGDTLTIDPNRVINGFVYMTGDGSGTETSTILLSTGGSTEIHGALVAEGKLVTQYAGAPGAADQLTVTYDRAVLDRLRLTYGSWVRLGAAWRDFKLTP